MTDGQPTENSPPGSEKNQAGAGADATTAGKLPPGGKADAARVGGASNPGELTKEEQMALYEKDLRENDWGHQPC